VELLDDPDVDPLIVRRSLRDVARSNALFGGTRAVLAELRPLIRRLARERGGDLTLLDVGTGIADIPDRARRAAERHGIRLTTVGLDESETLVSASRARMSAVVRGDALSLPIGDRSVDVVTCSQVLHHFSDDHARRVIRELDRVARAYVIISDIRRSWLAAGGIWVASFALGFHPVSRHDGVVSVMRGYTRRELRDLVGGALGRAPAVRRRAGFRITACWIPEDR
jgi:SAM-dependent methyltransferase